MSWPLPFLAPLADMLATLLIWLMAAVGVLKLADLFLSQAQKDSLANAVVKLWSILDEAKGWSFADWLRKPQATGWLVFSLGLLWLIIWPVYVRYELNKGKPEGEPVSVWLLGFFFTLVLGGLIITWTRDIFERLLNFSSGKVLVRRLAKIALLTLFVYAICYWIVALTVGSSLEWIGLISGIFLGWPTGLVIICLLTILVARALAYLVSVILYVGEFIVRRIAEYPKGPVLAVSAFFGGIAALIKAFG